MVCFENIAVTAVVIVVAGLESIELPNDSFAEEWPKGLLCLSLRNAYGLVSGDVGVEDTHGVKRGLRGIAVHPNGFECARFYAERGSRRTKPVGTFVLPANGAKYSGGSSEYSAVTEY